MDSCASLYVQLCFTGRLCFTLSVQLCFTLCIYALLCFTSCRYAQLCCTQLNVHSCVALNCTAMFHCIYYICTSLFANRISQLRVSPSWNSSNVMMPTVVYKTPDHSPVLCRYIGIAYFTTVNHLSMSGPGGKQWQIESRTSGTSRERTKSTALGPASKV